MLFRSLEVDADLARLARRELESDASKLVARNRRGEDWSDASLGCNDPQSTTERDLESGDLRSSSAYPSHDRTRPLTLFLLPFRTRTTISILPFPSNPSFLSRLQNSLPFFPLSIPTFASTSNLPSPPILTFSPAFLSAPSPHLPSLQSSHLSTTPTSLFSLLCSTTPALKLVAKPRRA